MVTSESSSPLRRALVVRHHVEDDAGLVGLAFEARGFEVRTVLIDANHQPPSVVADDVVVVLGSNCSVHDPAVRDAWFGRERDFLQEVDDAGIPILGICFGAQALCDLFGGTVVPADQEEMGWFYVDVADGVGLSEGPWFQYHADRCELPPEAQIWATTDLAVQAFSIGAHVGVQFHPEIDAAQLSRWFDSLSGPSRAHSNHQTALLVETRTHESAARVRAQQLVDLFLAHVAAAKNTDASNVAE